MRYDIYVRLRDAMDEFVESEHPRDDDGKFTDKNGGGASGESTTKLKDGFEIAHETRKAYLLKKDGKTFWVQKKWVRPDGSLTPAAQKNFENEPTDEQKQKDKEEAAKRWREGQPIPKPDWESDKAYGFDLWLDFYDIEKDKKVRVFIPKSVIQENGNIPNWILNKKLAEIEEEYKQWGGFAIDESPFERGALSKRHNDLVRWQHIVRGYAAKKEIENIIKSGDY